MARTESTKGPLDGIVVADFSRVLAGPYCSMLLGDLGATVIKIESPAGDETRSWVPPMLDRRSTYFLSINRNKSSIVLDLTDQGDLAIAQRIASSSDVVLENLMPGKMKAFGLSYDDLEPVNPSLVYASISGFGDLAGSALPGYDLLVQAMSGFMSLTGAEDGPAYRAGFALFDVLGGLHLAFAILAALRNASLTGSGQHLRTDLLSVALSSMVNQTASVALAGVTPTRLGNSHPSIVPYEPFTTAHGDIVLAVGNDRQFARLCHVIGANDLPDDPKASTTSARTANRQYVHERIETAVRIKPAYEWLDLLQTAGVPAGVVNDVASGLRLAESLGLSPVVDIDGEPTIRNPVRYSRTPAEYRRRPPDLGADREEILRWLDALPGSST